MCSEERINYTKDWVYAAYTMPHTTKPIIVYRYSIWKSLLSILQNNYLSSWSLYYNRSDAFTKFLSAYIHVQHASRPTCIYIIHPK